MTRVWRQWAEKGGLLVTAVLTISCDQITKHLAMTRLADRHERVFLDGSFRLVYAENAGAFLSLGAGLPPWARVGLFSFGTAIVLAIAVVTAVRHRWPQRSLVGLSLVLAGGLSNLLDRLARGTVVDFLNVGVGPLRTGIFNVADMAILAGLALLLIGSRGQIGTDPTRAGDQTG